MWHWVSNLHEFNWLSGRIVHQIKGGKYFSCLLISYTHARRHPTIHGTQASVCLTRDHDAHGVRNGAFCHIWLCRALAWWMTQQESEPDSTRQRRRVPFAPYIHKSLIIALCWLAMCIFTPVCTCIKVQGLVLKTFKFICVSGESLYWCHLSGEEKTHTDTHIYSRFHPVFFFFKRTVKGHCSTWPILFSIQTASIQMLQKFRTLPRTCHI